MFFQAQETVLSAIGGCRVEQGSRLPAMRRRSLNNFHKKWDNNNKNKKSQ